jgi:hypothetical protein
MQGYDDVPFFGAAALLGRTQARQSTFAVATSLRSVRHCLKVDLESHLGANLAAVVPIVVAADAGTTEWPPARGILAGRRSASLEVQRPLRGLGIHQLHNSLRTGLRFRAMRTKRVRGVNP